MRPQFVAAAILASLAQSAVGCDSGPLDREAHYLGAHYIAIGRVEAERYLSKSEIAALPGSGAGAGARPREVHVVSLEAVVGEAPSVSRVLVPCGAAFPAVGERVVYGETESGSSWVYPAGYGEPILQEFIAGES